jgi:predicted CXXCH cytochrome family protein
VSGTAIDHGFIVERGGALESTGTLSGGLRRVAGDVLRIGRGTNAELRFEDPAVALEHARLERRDDGLWAVDQGSVTGTYVNGQAVSEAKLADGDRLEIGGHGLTVRLQPGAPVVVRVAPQVALDETPVAAAVPGGPAGPAVAARVVDYVAAYRLRHGVFGKLAVSLVLVALAAAAVAWVALDSDRHVAFRPGDYSVAHQQAIATALEGEPRAVGCLLCHAPGRGAVDALCADCHAAGETAHWQAAPAAVGAGGPVHPANEPQCVVCHGEHRGEQLLKLVDDRLCVDCHRDLGAVFATGTPRFAPSLTGFDGHPPLSIGPATARVPLAEARDGTPLSFSHAGHLVPRLQGPAGPERLDCLSCHQSEPGGDHRDLLAVDYDLHCQRCHELGLGPGLELAEHGLDGVALYRDVLGKVATADRSPTGAVTDRAVRLRPLPRSRQEELAAQSLARQKEQELYGDQCIDCHLGIDLAAEPHPRVEPPAIPLDWMPFSSFTHGKHFEHTDLACTDCHAGAATSATAADVLMPDLAVCQPCHGETAAATEHRAETPCYGCHAYHPPAPTVAGRVAAGVN